MTIPNFSTDEENRIIEMAWEDRTPFDIIHKEFNLTHDELIRCLLYTSPSPRD